MYHIPYQSITYEGITYKSVLECRYHIFLSTLGVIHTYEPKRFSFPEFYGTDCYIYTPDFALLSCNYDYLEIKPSAPTVQEYAKLRALSQRGYKCALFAGRCHPDMQVYLFEDGHRKYISRTSVFLQQCFQFKLNGRQGETIAALKTVLGKGDYMKAFRKAWEWKA